MNVLFFPCYVDGLPRTAASVRFRAEWPAKYWPEAKLYPNNSMPIVDYDAYIFQKAYLTDMPRRLIRELRARDKLLAFDMCDADWMQSEEHEKRLLSVLPLFDFAVATMPVIRDYLATWVPTRIIPDRLDLDEFTARQEHTGDKYTSLVWFGYAHNLVELDKMWTDLCPVLDQYDLALTIISNELPEHWRHRHWGESDRRATFVRWTRKGANAEIAKHDIALVPQTSPYKSNNRVMTAYALGVLPAWNSKGLRDLITTDTRRRLAAMGRKMVEQDYDVRASVQQWKDYLDEFAEQQALDRSVNDYVHNVKGG